MSNPIQGPSVTESSSSSFFQIWIDALTKPSEQTFAAIASSPKAKAMTGYIWVFVASLVGSFLSLISEGALLRSQLTQAGVGAEQVRGTGGVIATLICGAPIAALIGTILFAILVALVQWIAKMFGGQGNNDQLAYATAAIGAPASLVSGILLLLAAIPFVGFCFRIIAGLFGLYVIVLQIMAIKGVNRFGWGPAIGSWARPYVAILLVCCCAAAIVASLTGAALGNIFNTINSSLTP